MTLCDSTDCSLPGSSVCGILQARILEWVAISFSRGFSQPKDWTWVSCIAGGFFTIWATREALIYIIFPSLFCIYLLLYKCTYVRLLLLFFLSQSPFFCFTGEASSNPKFMFSWVWKPLGHQADATKTISIWELPLIEMAPWTKSNRVSCPVLISVKNNA